MALAVDLVEPFKASEDLNQLTFAILNAAEALGFSGFGLFQMNSKRTFPPPLLLHRLPQRWVDFSIETSAYANSPIMKAVTCTHTPFFWSELGGLIKLEDRHRQYLHDAARLEMSVGLTVPIHPPGRPTGFVSFVGNDANKISPYVMPDAMFVATSAFQRATELRRHDLINSSSDLDAEDREILTLIGRGLTPATITATKGFSSRRIKETLHKATRRYGVASPTEVIVNALFERTIHFEDLVR